MEDNTNKAYGLDKLAQDDSELFIHRLKEIFMESYRRYEEEELKKERALFSEEMLKKLRNHHK